MSGIRFQCVTYASRAEAQEYYSKLLSDAERYRFKRKLEKAKSGQLLADRMKLLMVVEDPSGTDRRRNNARIARRGLRIPFAVQALFSLQSWKHYLADLGAGRRRQSESF